MQSTRQASVFLVCLVASSSLLLLLPTTVVAFTTTGTCHMTHDYDPNDKTMNDDDERRTTNRNDGQIKKGQSGHACFVSKKKKRTTVFLVVLGALFFGFVCLRVLSVVLVAVVGSMQNMCKCARWRI